MARSNQSLCARYFFSFFFLSPSSLEKHAVANLEKRQHLQSLLLNRNGLRGGPGRTSMLVAGGCWSRSPLLFTDGAAGVYGI